ncbi:MAG TPA: alpha/beta hydrolase, partial [Ilumatobacteraceae bacterium]|nr:alpha/beta hydrolase [Ilumatobacteraceae bacterium]
MSRAVLPTGIELEYVTTGDPADPPLLVVNGYTSQLISWPQGYVEQLVAQGLFVIQFDNRDVGLST